MSFSSSYSSPDGIASAKDLLNNRRFSVPEKHNHRNTVRYMIDELQEENKRQKEEIERQNKQLERMEYDTFL